MMRSAFFVVSCTGKRPFKCAQSRALRENGYATIKIQFNIEYGDMKMEFYSKHLHKFRKMLVVLLEM